MKRTDFRQLLLDQVEPKKEWTRIHLVPIFDAHIRKRKQFIAALHCFEIEFWGYVHIIVTAEHWITPGYDDKRKALRRAWSTSYGWSTTICVHRDVLLQAKAEGEGEGDE